MFGKIPKSLSDLRDVLPELKRTVKIPVYLIHNSLDSEDYFFLIDFEEFVERSKSGVFVRPSLEIWAGRDDFSRTIFARYFRETFTVEFDQMRQDLVDEAERRSLGWLTLGGLAVGAVGGAALIFSNAFLMLAAGAGIDALASTKKPGIPKFTKKQRKLESKIEDTRSRAELALARVNVQLHPELYDHAFREGHRGPNAMLKRDAWPLPANVRNQLIDACSSSWW